MVIPDLIGDPVHACKAVESRKRHSIEKASISTGKALEANGSLIALRLPGMTDARLAFGLDNKGQRPTAHSCIFSFTA